MRRILLATVLALPAASPLLADPLAVSYGPRPGYLIDKLPEGDLKTKLASCEGQTPSASKFSIGHRGAPLMFPEHTVESNRAAARLGAGILECDVTFTSDLELVCRHAQNDLHTTTNMVASDLADKCTTPFSAASGDAEASAECRTSDITLAEFRTLTPKMDAADKTAVDAEGYLGGTPGFRTELYVDDAQMMTHKESIALFDSLGADFTPELKAPSVEMPFNGFSQDDYAQKLLDEYEEAGIDPSRVWPQSFQLRDVMYWIENGGDYGKQAVFLVEPEDSFDGQKPETWAEDFEKLAADGVKYLAPSINMLVVADESGAIVASDYAKAAKAAGLELITWSLERSGPLKSGGGWYYAPLNDVIDSDGYYYIVLDALAQDVGVIGVFSDWPGTVTYYANCMGL